MGRYAPICGPKQCLVLCDGAQISWRVFILDFVELGAIYRMSTLSCVIVIYCCVRIA